MDAHLPLAKIAITSYGVVSVKRLPVYIKNPFLTGAVLGDLGDSRRHGM